MSFKSSAFANGLNLHCELLDIPIRVSTPVGESVIVEKVYRSCPVTFMDLCRLGYLRNGGL